MRPVPRRGRQNLMDRPDRHTDPSDQACLFLQLSPTTWVKAGLEFDNDELYAGGVVTYPYSDW